MTDLHIDLFKQDIANFQNKGIKLAELARRLGITPACLWRLVNLGKKIDSQLWEKWLQIKGEY